MTVSWSRAGLFTVVFLSGAGILAVEILAIRHMVPAFGASIFIWGAVLSVTLLCLAAGYGWGGRLADGVSDPRTRMSLHILISAVWVAALPLWDALLLRLGLWAGPALGPIVTAVGLLGVPITLLATVVPLAFRGSYQEDQSRPGGTVGDLFATSTAGSVAGALLTAYLAIPLLGVSRSFFVTAALLFLLALPDLLRGRWMRTGILLLAVLTVGRMIPGGFGASVRLDDGVRFLHRAATRYAQLDVVQDSRDGTRIMLLDGTGQSWVGGRGWKDSLYHYVPTVLEQVQRHGLEPGRALVLGLGAGTLVRGLHERGFEVEVVELDPEVLDAAIEWFDFPEGPFEVHLRDARAFLNEPPGPQERFDLLMVDVGTGGSPPEHVFSLEAFEGMARHLEPDGLLVVNVIAHAHPPRDRVVQHTAATAARVFPQVEILDMDPGATRAGRLTEMLLVASRRDRLPPHPTPSRYKVLPFDASARPLTDDWNPIPLWSVGSVAEIHRDAAGWLGEAVQLPH